MAHLRAESCVILLAILSAPVITSSCTSEAVDLSQSPAAFAGFDAFVETGATVPLDGAASTDPDGDALAYRWRIEAKPKTSSGMIADPSSAVTSFVADLEGTFVVSLAVSDGNFTSRDLVTFSARTIETSTIALELALDPIACNADFDAIARAPCATPDGKIAIEPHLDAETPPDAKLEWNLLRVPAGVDAAGVVLESPDGPLGKLTFAPPRPGEYWISARVSAGSQYSPLMLASVGIFSGDAEKRPLPKIEAKSSTGVLQRVLFDARASVIPTSSTAEPVTRRWSFVLDPSEGSDALADLATGCAQDYCRVLFPSTAGVYIVTHQIERGGLAGVSALHALEVK